jgi:hypothetical protein
MGDQTQAYDIFQTPLSSGYPLPLRSIHCKKGAIFPSQAGMYSNGLTKLALARNNEIILGEKESVSLVTFLLVTGTFLTFFYSVGKHLDIL